VVWGTGFSRHLFSGKISTENGSQARPDFHLAAVKFMHKIPVGSVYSLLENRGGKPCIGAYHQLL
jgi:hypothetical protein